MDGDFNQVKVINAFKLLVQNGDMKLSFEGGVCKREGKLQLH